MRPTAGTPIALLSVALFAATARPDDAPGTVPFRLGTFEHRGRVFLGLVRGDQAVVDIAAANGALQRRHPDWKALVMPSDMTELIERYEDGLRERLHAIASEAGAASARPGYVHDLKALRVRPPVRPETMLNAAVNYTEHEAEMQRRQAAPPPSVSPQSAPGLWQRRPDDTRHNPYLFVKPRTAVIADGEAIRVPPGRDRIDWECELAVVVGRKGHHVPVDRAREHVFGYTLENDVSDRGGRGDARHGSDWLVGKGHDTFAPLGPFIVPKEFVPDPHRLGIRFTLSGTRMQDSTTAQMTHTVDEMLHYASNILTLRPGDVIATGSPAGVGSARNPPIFMTPGDVAVCTIDGIGTLTNPVAAAAPVAAAEPEGPEKVIALVLFPDLTLLEGRRATTHWASADELEKLGGRYVRKRWVEDGKFITAGGVSAGIDMALALAERLTDAATARRIQLGIEYDPHPPLGGIDWSRVGEAERERQRQGGTGRRLKDAARLLASRPDLLRRLGIDPQEKEVNR